MLYSSIKGQKSDNGCTFQYYCPADQCIYKKESNRYFATFKLLKQHYQKVHAEKVYKCDKCPAAFGLERELRRHVGHCGILYKCGSCPASYTTRETLQSHCNRKTHTFPVEYAAKNSKQKSGDKNPAAATPEPKPLPVAVLILGVPIPTNNQPKLPKAILPKDIETTIQGIAAAQAQHTELPVKDLEAPGKHNAVIQTEIYGVENLAVEGQENQIDRNRGLGMKTNKAVSKAVHKSTKAKLKGDKENPAVSRNKKSSTGMQTSVSLFSRKRLKTVTGTQTSGDYILKKAMASANIPIQRKTVASQVTPQKPNANLKRKTSTCSSETQTGVSPEKQSKIDKKKASTVNGKSGSQEEKQVTNSDNVTGCQTDSLGDSLSTSTQTLQSYLENLKEGVQTNGSFLSFSLTGNLIITPQNVVQTDNSQVTENANQPQLSQEKAVICRATEDQDSSSILKNTTVDVDNFTNSNAMIKATEHADGTASVESNSLDSEFQTQSGFDSALETNKIVKQGCFQDNNPPLKKKAQYHKGRKTIRNLLDESTNKHKIETVSALPNTKSLISTTSGITFNNSKLTYAVVQNPQLESSVPPKITEQPEPVVKGGESDYDSHKLFNPVKDEMFSSKANDAGNTIDMEAQTMSADEFERLLLASGLLLEEPQSPKVSEITGVNYLKSTPLCATTDVDTGKITTDFVHKEMETEMLTGPEFDFLNETCATIDMNTQTITDFGSLFGETCGPTDSDTQTVANIDFLDLVMTNMETQTLSDRDLIDLGLMDPNQRSVKPNNSAEDDLKTSQTQTSFTAQKLDDANKLNKNNEEETNTSLSNEISTVIVTDIVLKKEVNATETKTDNQGENRTAVEQTISDTKDDTEEHVTTPFKQTETQPEQTDRSNDFQTTNMETQTAFDDLEKMLLE